MQPRYYQTEALSAAQSALRAGHHPALQLATGTGKSLIIALLAEWARGRGRRTWVLTHVQELVKQNSETYYRATQDITYGVVCAGLNRADYDRDVTFATIQSIINPGLRGDLPAPDLIIIDEAHRVPHATGDEGMYQRLFARYPAARRLAMTATPWRLEGGLIYGRGEGFWFDQLAYRYTVPQAVADGYLAPIVGVETEQQLDLEAVDIAGDYVMSQVAEQQDNDWLAGVARSLSHLGRHRKHIAVYAPTITAALRAHNAIYAATGWAGDVLTSRNSRTERDEQLRRFTSGELRFLVSVDTLTTGFDFPALDCIACLRPTVSSSLWVQIMGRGTRLAEGKRDCLLLDYAGNLQRLGGVDTLDSYVRERGGEAVEQLPAEPAPVKPKRERRTLPGVRALPVLDPMTGAEALEGATLEVDCHAVSAIALPTRRNPRVPVLLVQYAATTREGARIDASRFISTEEYNAEAEEFFLSRALAVNLPAPAKALLWQVRGARQPARLTVRKRGRYWNVIAEEFTPNPEE